MQLSLTDSHPNTNIPTSSHHQTTSSQADEPFMLHYHDRDHCEHHITCKTMYDALVWAREEAFENASSVRIYKLCHTELAP